jgi:epoxyqueuosine reductase QueG
MALYPCGDGGKIPPISKFKDSNNHSELSVDVRILVQVFLMIRADIKTLRTTI